MTRLVDGLVKRGWVTPFFLRAMTRLVDGLVKRGWVDRVRDTDDRRRVRVTLNTLGRAEAERLSGLTDEIVDSILQAIPRDKRSQVIESLAILRQAVHGARSNSNDCP